MSRRRLASAFLALAAGVTSVSLAACRATGPTLGPTTPAARDNADALFRSVAVRFIDVIRAPKFAQSRRKIGRYALSPSGVYGDTSVWSSVATDGWRALSLRGTLTPNGYSFVPMPGAPRPTTAGDARHHMALRRIGDGEYEWVTDVDHAIGPVTAEEIGNAITSLLTGAEHRTDRELRNDYAAHFPRTTRALAKIFSLDSLRTTRQVDGSTLLFAGATFHAERLDSANMHAFARYIRKYISPSRYYLTLRDPAGAIWVESRLEDDLITIRLRSRDGALLPLAGPAREMPDSLQLRMDLSERFMIFRVGVTNMVADFVIRRTAHFRSWDMRFRTEPEWQIPLALSNFMKASLHRPFDKGGMVLSIGVRDGEGGGSSVLERHAYVAVRESAIVRWIGGLGFSAMSEFVDSAEKEENRWLVDVLGSLRGDFLAQFGARCGSPERACGEWDPDSSRD